MSTDAEVVDGAAFEEAVKSVRSDKSADTYMVIGHTDNDPTRINVITVGQDNNEIASYMDENAMLYAFARYETKFDMSTTVKFVYIRWIGELVPIQKKGRFGVVHGSVEKRFNPYHILIQTSTTEDIDTEKILHQIDETSGIKSRVIENTDGCQERGFTQTQVPKRTTGQKYYVNDVSRGGIKLDIDPEVTESIHLLREKKDNIHWVLAGYKDGNPKGPIIVVNKGEGTVDELRENLAEDQAMYGLYRVTDNMDENIKTVKFVYIVWLGNEVKPMTRAKVSTHRGLLEETFGQAHVNMFASELEEITEELVLDKVTSASGTRSHVKE